MDSEGQQSDSNQSPQKHNLYPITLIKLVEEKKPNKKDEVKKTTSQKMITLNFEWISINMTLGTLKTSNLPPKANHVPVQVYICI